MEARVGKRVLGTAVWGSVREGVMWESSLYSEVLAACGSLPREGPVKTTNGSTKPYVAILRQKGK